MKIKAPFNEDQISNIRHHQFGAFRPMTCPNSHTIFPTTNGMVCSVCEYTQDWVHDYTTYTYVDPFKDILKKSKLKKIINEIFQPK